MKNYSKDYVNKIQNKVVEINISENEKKYHVLKDEDKGYFIHQVITEGLELIKIAVKVKTHYEYDNKSLENCLTLRYLKEGEVTVRYPDGKELILKAGELFISYGGKNAEETFIPKVGIRIEQLIIVLGEIYLDKFKEDPEVVKTKMVLKENKIQNNKKFIRNIQFRLINIFDLIIRYDLSWGKKLYAFAKINEVLSGVIVSFLKNLLDVDSHLEDEIENIKRYIEENYHKSDILVDVHKKFYVNRGELSKKFKEQTGQGMHEYLKNIKLEQAYKLLRDENKKVSEVASIVGYENYGYFSKIFKKHFGVYPLEIKKKHFE